MFTYRVPSILQLRTWTQTGNAIQLELEVLEALGSVVSSSNQDSEGADEVSGGKSRWG